MGKWGSSTRGLPGPALAVAGVVGVAGLFALSATACKQEGDSSSAGDKPAGLPAQKMAAPMPAPAAPAPAPKPAGGEAEAVPDAPDPAQSVSGKIVIADGLRKQV